MNEQIVSIESTESTLIVTKIKSFRFLMTKNYSLARQTYDFAKKELIHQERALYTPLPYAKHIYENSIYKSIGEKKTLYEKKIINIENKIIIFYVNFMHRKGLALILDMCKEYQNENKKM